MVCVQVGMSFLGLLLRSSIAGEGCLHDFSVRQLVKETVGDEQMKLVECVSRCVDGQIVDDSAPQFQERTEFAVSERSVISAAAAPSEDGSSPFVQFSSVYQLPQRWSHLLPVQSVIKEAVKEGISERTVELRCLTECSTDLFLE